MSALLGLRGNDELVSSELPEGLDQAYVLSRLIAEAECDEELLDRRRSSDSA
jgi:hypothetical protein